MVLPTRNEDGRKETFIEERKEEMKKKSLWRKAKKGVKKLGNDFSKTPLARAARGKHTEGFI